MSSIPWISPVLPPPLCLSKYKAKPFCTMLTKQSSSGVLPKNKYFEQNVSMLPVFIHRRGGVSGRSCDPALGSAAVPRGAEGAQPRRWGSLSLGVPGVPFPGGVGSPAAVCFQRALPQGPARPRGDAARDGQGGPNHRHHAPARWVVPRRSGQRWAWDS